MGSPNFEGNLTRFGAQIHRLLPKCQFPRPIIKIMVDSYTTELLRKLNYMYVYIYINTSVYIYKCVYIYMGKYTQCIFIPVCMYIVFNKQQLLHDTVRLHLFIHSLRSRENQQKKWLHIDIYEYSLQPEEDVTQFCWRPPISNLDYRKILIIVSCRQILLFKVPGWQYNQALVCIIDMFLDEELIK